MMGTSLTRTSVWPTTQTWPRSAPRKAFDDAAGRKEDRQNDTQSKVTTQEIQKAEDWLNAYPREILGFLSADAVFSAGLASLV